MARVRETGALGQAAVLVGFFVCFCGSSTAAKNQQWFAYSEATGVAEACEESCAGGC